MSWIKIAEDGWDGKSWAVTKLRDGAYNGKKGQHTFKLPNIAPGEYIIRPEIIALHEGNRQSGAQFYMECIHVKVGGSGTTALPAGVAIPGYVTATTPGVLFDIYSGFTSYPNPGPKLWSGAAGTSSAAPAAAAPAASAPAAAAPAAPAASAPAAAAPAPASGATAQKWHQCGGQGYSGPTNCVSGTKCTKQNDYYSQCM
jgi:cellulase